MNQDEKNNDNQEKKQNRWKCCTVGTCIAVAAYGIYKLLKKEEWKLAEVIGSGVAGASVSSLVAPKLVKLARDTQWSLRSKEQKTYPVYSYAPDGSFKEGQVRTSKRDGLAPRHVVHSQEPDCKTQPGRAQGVFRTEVRESRGKNRHYHGLSDCRRTNQETNI